MSISIPHDNVAETDGAPTAQAQAEEPTGGVSRRSFLATGVAIGAGATLGPLGRATAAFGAPSSGTLTPRDAAILRFRAAAEILESDLWQQYNELGGIQEVPGGSGSRRYTEALEVLDEGMPQYRRRDVIEFEQTREQAEWRDAAAAEKSEHERKPPPKRTHVAAHDRKLDEARHQQRVAQLAVERAERELIAALDEHGEEWTREVDEQCSTLRDRWSDEIAKVSELYGRLEQADRVARVVSSGRQPRIGSLDFAPGQVHGQEWASQQPSSVRPYVATGDALAALADLGHLEPEPEPVVQPPRPRKSSPLEDMAPVQAERRDREAVAAKIDARREELLAEQDADDQSDAAEADLDHRG